LEFLDLVNAGLPISRACKIIGISRPTAYRWQLDFNDNGLPSLNDQPENSRSISRKINHKYYEEIINFALRFPQFGAESLSDKLQEKQIRVSTGTIHNTLKKNALSTKKERLAHLLKKYQKDPKTLSSDSKHGLKHLSRHFNYKCYSTQEPGDFLFVWKEIGGVSNSRQRIPFYVFLDACGSVSYIYADINCYNLSYSMIPFEVRFEHSFVRPLKEALKRFYNYFDIPVKSILVKKGNDPADILHDQLGDLNIEVRCVSDFHFNNIPYIADYKKHFTREFLRKELKTVHHRRLNQETIFNIGTATSDYLNAYNNSPILTWPNLGRTPYQYAGESVKKELHLPTFKEYKAHLLNNDKKVQNN